MMIVTVRVAYSPWWEDFIIEFAKSNVFRSILADYKV